MKKLSYSTVVAMASALLLTGCSVLHGHKNDYLVDNTGVKPMQIPAGSAVKTGENFYPLPAVPCICC